MYRTGSRCRRMLGLCVAVMLVMGLTPIAPAAAATGYYVDPVSGSDVTGTGSQALPFESIYHAMGLAASGDTIYLQPGVYEAPNETFPIVLKPGVEIVGLEGAAETILDAGDVGRVVEILNATGHTGLWSLTVTGGSSGWGAGINIYQDASAPSTPGWPVVADCIIEGNVASLGGGGIQVEGQDSAHVVSPVILRCAIGWNSASDTNIGGGVLSLNHAVPEIRDCWIHDNSAGYGGGAYLYRGIVESSDITDNTGVNEGGGINVGAGSVIRDSQVRDNSTGGVAGGICLNWFNGNFTLERVEVVGNVAGGMGGGIAVRGAASASLKNVVVAENTSAANGAAVFVEGVGGLITDLTLDGCTVVGNTSTSFDGIFVDSDEHVTIRSSIIDHGTGDVDDAQDILAAAPTQIAIYNSLTHHTALTGTGVIHGDPRFIDKAAGNYELELGSPCIDTGDPASTLTDDFLNRPRPVDGDGNGTARVDMGAYERPLAEVARIAGTNRYETAGIMAQWREWPGTTAVLASGMGFADALSGSGLAGTYQGPLLLTAKDSVPGIVFDALQDAGITDVVIVGGTAVVSDAVKVQLQAQGYGVTRVWGPNRYATAAAVAVKIAEIKGPDFSGTAFLARGDEFADALAASPIAYAQAMPVLLTATGSLPGETKTAITSLGIGEVIVVGGTSAVTDGVKNAVEALPAVATDRWAAANRYAAGAVVANNAVAAGLATWNQVGIATGTNFPDALAGGALCGIRNGVLLLTQPTALPSATYDALHTNRLAVVYAEVYGGTSAVTEGVRAAINTALGW